jgi:nitrite reductase/ring-hydroxylating ferredoxin subunit/uncharacterized membrane protein
VLRKLTEAIEGSEAVDGLSAVLDIEARVTRGATTKNLLSGTWLGHTLHPLLTDIPIGTWVSASVLDLIGGRSSRRAADGLVLIGVLATGPTAAAGLADWDDTSGGDRRVGAVHAVLNTAGLVLQLASLRERRRGRRIRATGLSLAALGAVGVGGYLGSHLIYVSRVGVDAEVDAPEVGAWRDVASLDELPERAPKGVDVDGGSLVLVRDGVAVYALAARCSHAGGPLEEGEAGSDGTITCPWHGSTFSLVDGEVVRAPATSPQPAYETRVLEGRVQVRSL